MKKTFISSKKQKFIMYKELREAGMTISEIQVAHPNLISL